MRLTLTPSEIGLCIAAGLLVAMPPLLAFDYGGVLMWTQWVAAVAVLAIVVVTGLCWLKSRDSSTSRVHTLLIPLGIWVVLVAVQLIPVPTGILSWLSPASAEAHTQWVQPFVDPSDSLTFGTVSVSPYDTRHALAVLAVVFGIVWASSIVFGTRLRLGLLLNAIALSGAIIALIGLLRLLAPGALGPDMDVNLTSSSFATFVNRNHAALMLNLGLAASLGLLSWRLTALTGIEVDDPDFEWNDFFSLVSDRESAIGLASAVLCITGLLVNGSRGGVVAAIIGMLLAFGWVRQRRGFISYPVVAFVIALCVGILVIPTDLSFESLQRLEFLARSDKNSLLNDGRLTHWPDGLKAAMNYFPMGSGTGTYGDAVQPFLQTSVNNGFQHADNLWVELFTEQSIWGLALALWMIVLIARALNRLNESSDPLDQGLRIAGWYALGALIVSQAFDFGLVIPANLFSLAIFFPAIITREVVTRTSYLGHERHATQADDRTLPKPRRSRPLMNPKYDRHLAYGWMGCALVCGLLAIPRLAHDAHIDAMSRGIKAQSKWLVGDDDGLAAWIKTLESYHASDPSPVIASQLADLYYDRARLLDVSEQFPEDRKAIIRLYEQTERDRRRQIADRAPSASENVVDDGLNSSMPEAGSFALYQQSLKYSTDTIRRRPLGQPGRPYQIYLDFVHRDSKRTRSALNQLASLYAKEPSTLIQIAGLAADGGELTLATKHWRNAIEAKPQLTSQALSLASARGISEFDAIIPDNTDCYREAAQFVLNHKHQDPELLNRALNRLDCDKCETLRERSNCERLASDVANELGNASVSIKHSQAAVRYNPGSADLRMILIQRLKDAGQRREALEMARESRELIQKDPRFTQIIELMAKEDLEEVEKRNRDSASK